MKIAVETRGIALEPEGPQGRKRTFYAKQSLRASASIAIRSLRGSVGALVKASFQAMNG